MNAACQGNFVCWLSDGHPGPHERIDEHGRPVPLTTPVRGYHACIRCRLAMIPDSEPRALCRFCERSEAIERAARGV